MTSWGGHRQASWAAKAVAISRANSTTVESVDLTEFSGLNSEIESVELLDVEKKDFGDGEKEVRQILIKSKNLNTEDKPVYAYEYIPLKKDSETGDWGFSEHENSKAMMFLNFFKVGNFEDLKGIGCLIVSRKKGDKTFLGIHHG